jgi:hypothetical protein
MEWLFTLSNGNRLNNAMQKSYKKDMYSQTDLIAFFEAKYPPVSRVDPYTPHPDLPKGFSRDSLRRKCNGECFGFKPGKLGAKEGYETCLAFMKKTGIIPYEPYERLRDIQDHFFFSFAMFHGITHLQDENVAALVGNYRSYKYSHDIEGQVSVGHVEIIRTTAGALKITEKLWRPCDLPTIEPVEITYEGYIWFRGHGGAGIGSHSALLWIDIEGDRDFVRVTRLLSSHKTKGEFKFLHGTTRYASPNWKGVPKFFSKKVRLERISQQELKDPDTFMYREPEALPSRIQRYIKPTRQHKPSDIY